MVARKKTEAARLEEVDPQFVEKDLLSLLIRSNMKEDATEALDDETLLAQIGTVIAAGYDTTGISVSCSLFALARNPAIQTKLREEVLAYHSDSPSMEELIALPYLDIVVKETLRLHPAITAVHRVALKDAIIPLSKPILDKNGNEVHELLYVLPGSETALDQRTIPDVIQLSVQAGQTVDLNIFACNISKDWWGPDALEFR